VAFHGVSKRVFLTTQCILSLSMDFSENMTKSWIFENFMAHFQNGDTFKISKF
jgi:hypothetical protein